MSRVDRGHFEVFSPEAPGPVVVEVPHAGLCIDEAAARFTRPPPKAIAAGALLADSDIGADLLWRGADRRGIAVIIAHASRYVIDLNTEPRLPTAYEEKLPAPLRSVMVRSQCGLRWREDPLPREELDRRIREVQEPYHAAVTAALEAARRLHGRAVLVSSHTFPERRGASQVVVGTRHGAAAPDELRQGIAEVVRASGLSVAIEEPFPGGFSLKRHARPSEGLFGVQIEVARSLLGPNPTQQIDPDAVARLRAMLEEVCARVSAIALQLDASLWA